MVKVMVVGASGVLGKLVCREFLRLFENDIRLIVTDYKEERGKKLANSLNEDVQFKCLDVQDEENIKQVMKDVDLVVVGLKQNAPLIQRVCIEQKILCIDVTPFDHFVNQVIEFDQLAAENHIGSVVMSGFFPGLSGLMIQKAIANFQEVTEINVALLQNTNAKAGVSGILDMLKIIAQSVVVQGKALSGFTKKRNMYFLHHATEQEVRLINHSERVLIHDRLIAVPIYYWTAWNSNGFNKLVSVLRKMGVIQYAHHFTKLLSKVVKHNPNRNENAYLTVEVKGMIENEERTKAFALSTFSDYHTTAMVTASLSKIALQKELKGIVCPFEVTNVDELLSVMNGLGVRIEEMIK